MLTPFVARLNKEWRVDALLERAGRGGPVVAGAAFAIAWTPCVGPTLGAILSAAALSEAAWTQAIAVRQQSASDSAAGLRFFTVYGPWGRPDMAMFLFTRNIIEGIGSTDHVPFNEAMLPGFNVIKDFDAYDERTRHTNADYPERMTADEPGSRTFNPNSPKAISEPRQAFPFMRPRCCLRYFTFFGICYLGCAQD